MKNIIRHMIRDKRGNFASIFALLATPVMLSVTMAVDYANMLRVKSQTMHAADSGLMAATVAVKDRANWQDPSGRQDYVQLYNLLDQEFNTFFESNLKSSHSQFVTGYSTFFHEQQQEFSASIYFKYKLALMDRIFPDGISFVDSTKVYIDVDQGIALSMALVLDDSGSMRGQKSANMKNAIRDMLREFDNLDPESDNVRIAATSFSTTLKKTSPMTWDRNVIKNFVQTQFSTSGMTGPAASMEWATSELLDPEEDSLHQAASGYSPEKVLVILTDGAINQELTRFRNACTAAKNAGLTIYSIGFAMSTSSEREIKDCSGADDQHYSAANAQQLTEAFIDIAKKSTEVIKFTQ